MGKLNTYSATGRMHGYPWGVTITIMAKNIEDALETAQEQIEEPIQVSGPLEVEPK